MSGTKAGNKKAAKTIKEKYGPDYWKKVGALGGLKSRGGGFTKETAKHYGHIGGVKSGEVRGKARDERLAL